MYFDFKENHLECEDCTANADSLHQMVLDSKLLYIVRYIALTEYERLFSFKISERYQKKLTEFTERFVRYNLKGKFTALDLYRMLR